MRQQQRQDDDATQSARAREMSAMFHALDPEQKGWVSSIELFFLLDDSGAFERLPADVAAEELTAAGAPVNGSTRATAAVTLLDFVRYHEVLRRRSARGEKGRVSDGKRRMMIHPTFPRCRLVAGTHPHGIVHFGTLVRAIGANAAPPRTCRWRTASGHAGPRGAKHRDF